MFKRSKRICIFWCLNHVLASPKGSKDWVKKIPMAFSNKTQNLHLTNQLSWDISGGTSQHSSTRGYLGSTNLPSWEVDYEKREDDKLWKGDFFLLTILDLQGDIHLLDLFTDNVCYFIYFVRLMINFYSTVLEIWRLVTCNHMIWHFDGENLDLHWSKHMGKPL